MSVFTWHRTPRETVEDLMVVPATAPKIPERKAPQVNLTVDAHVDALWVNFKRQFLRREAPPAMRLKAMKSGGLDVAVFALYLHTNTMEGKSQDEIDLMIDWQVAVWREEFKLISEHRQYLGLEGGHLLGGSLQRLTELVCSGLRVLGLTHNQSNELGDSSTDKEYHKGLTEWGHRICSYCEEAAIVIDISHASDRTAHDVLDTTFEPVIASHSGCKRLTSVPRNLDDELIKKIAESKGVIGVPFAQNFVAPYQPVEHIDHIVQLTQSTDFVGIGSDLDGAVPIKRCPDVSHWREVTSEALVAKGYRDPDIHKICGGNFIRVLEGTTTDTKND